MSCVAPPTIGMSDFAKKRHVKGHGHSYYEGSFEDLIELVKDSWDKRTYGTGETTLERKVVVPIRVTGFHNFRCNSIKLTPDLKVTSKVGSRQPGEDLFVKTFVKKTWLQKLGLVKTPEGEVAKFVKVVCYNMDALLENNGSRSTDCEWEIVALLCSKEEKEPMHPLTMARNMLEKPGGTKSTYTAQEFAEAVYYWSQRVSL